MPTTVECVRSGAVATLRFIADNNVPVLSQSVLEALDGHLKALVKDKALRFVVLRSTGKVFIAGANILELQQLKYRTAYRYARLGQQVFERLANLPAITLAAISGACVGGGLEMVLACDVRIAAAGSRIGLPEATLGLFPGWGGSVRLHDLVGPVIARRLAMTGELMPAEDALRLGLVHEVAGPTELDARLLARLQSLAKAAPGIVRLSKAPSNLWRIYARGRTTTRTDPRLEKEAIAFADCFKRDEVHEGIAAFLEKRPAAWGKLDDPAT